MFSPPPTKYKLEADYVFTPVRLSATYFKMLGFWLKLQTGGDLDFGSLPNLVPLIYYFFCFDIQVHPEIHNVD